MCNHKKAIRDPRLRARQLKNSLQWPVSMYQSPSGEHCTTVVSMAALQEGSQYSATVRVLCLAMVMTLNCSWLIQNVSNIQDYVYLHGMHQYFTVFTSIPSATNPTHAQNAS